MRAQGLVVYPRDVVVAHAVIHFYLPVCFDQPTTRIRWVKRPEFRRRQPFLPDRCFERFLDIGVAAGRGAFPSAAFGGTDAAAALASHAGKQYVRSARSEQPIVLAIFSRSMPPAAPQRARITHWFY